MPSLRNEMHVLVRMSLPVALTQIGMMLTGVVDTLMLSRVSLEALGASALANMWQWTLLSIGLGAAMGIDPMVSQAYGRGDGQRTALALQRGLLTAGLVSVPICGGMLLTGVGLRWLGQPAEIAEMAQRYNLLKLPTVPCFLLFSVLRIYLQGRTVMAPATWVMWLVNCVNALLNWALIFGKLGSPALGLEGAAIASSLSTLLLALGLWAWMVAGGLHRGAWRPWDAASFDPRGQLEILRLGLPMGAQLALESCAFSLATFMAGWLDLAALGSHQIVLNMAALAFMLPLGISMGAAARVGNLIGAGDHAGMRRSVHAALILGAAAMSLSALIFTLFADELPRLYTDDAAVLPLATAILPIAAAFQLADGTQVVASGVLRGMGRPNIAAAINLIGYYVLALPLAYVLGFPLGQRLNGIWFGLAVGLFAVAIALALWAERTSRRPLAELTV